MQVRSSGGEHLLICLGKSAKQCDGDGCGRRIGQFFAGNNRLREMFGANFGEDKQVRWQTGSHGRLLSAMSVPRQIG